MLRPLFRLLIIVNKECTATVSHRTVERLTTESEINSVYGSICFPDKRNYRFPFVTVDTFAPADSENRSLQFHTLVDLLSIVSCQPHLMEFLRSMVNHLTCTWETSEKPNIQQYSSASSSTYLESSNTQAKKSDPRGMISFETDLSILLVSHLQRKIPNPLYLNNMSLMARYSWDVPHSEP